MHSGKLTNNISVTHWSPNSHEYCIWLMRLIKPPTRATIVQISLAALKGKSCDAAVLRYFPVFVILSQTSVWVGLSLRQQHFLALTGF